VPKGGKWYVVDAGLFAKCVTMACADMKAARSQSSACPGETLIVCVPKNAACKTETVTVEKTVQKDWMPDGENLT
jgi:hypothetical protein